MSDGLERKRGLAEAVGRVEEEVKDFSPKRKSRRLNPEIPLTNTPEEKAMVAISQEMVPEIQEVEKRGSGVSPIAIAPTWAEEAIKPTEIEEQIFKAMEDTIEKNMREGIGEVCRELKVTQTNRKTGKEEDTTFCLSYLYNRFLEPQLTRGCRDILEKKLTKKKRHTVKEIRNAKLFNYDVSITFSEEELKTFVGYCVSGKQLKFWKMLIYRYFARLNEILTSLGYSGSVRLVKGFYKNLDETFQEVYDEVMGKGKKKRDELLEK